MSFASQTPTTLAEGPRIPSVQNTYCLAFFVIGRTVVLSRKDSCRSVHRARGGTRGSPGEQERHPLPPNPGPDRRGHGPAVWLYLNHLVIRRHRHRTISVPEHRRDFRLSAWWDYRVRDTRISLDSSRSYSLAPGGPSINHAERLRDRRGDRRQRHSRFGVLPIPGFFRGRRYRHPGLYRHARGVQLV